LTTFRAFRGEFRGSLRRRATLEQRVRVALSAFRLKATRASVG